MRPSNTRFVAAALIAGAVFACGRTPEAPPGGTTAADASRDPKAVCSLLTAEEIASVLGRTPGAPRFENYQCIWPKADEPDEFLVQLMVTPASYRTYGEYAAAFREQMDGAGPAGTLEEIPNPGVGRFAVSFKDLPMVQIHTDSAMVQVATFGSQHDHALALAKKVAEKRR